MKIKQLKKKTLKRVKHFESRLFEEIGTLADQNLTGDDLEQEIKRAMALNELAKTAIAVAALLRRSETVQEKPDAKNPRNKKA